MGVMPNLRPGGPSDEGRSRRGGAEQPAHVAAVQAVGGRLPELRLAAGDAVTANYLADKVLQLESGSLLPATLGETPLRFQLYHRGSRQPSSTASDGRDAYLA